METNFIWKERKRNALGLPWTFTKYALTDDRLFITSGLLKTVEDEVRLYRIVDLSLSQTLSQKIFGIGTIQVSSADKSMRDFEIKNIKKPRDVKEQLSKLVEENRDKKRVTNREFMGEDADFGDDDGTSVELVSHEVAGDLMSCFVEGFLIRNGSQFFCLFFVDHATGKNVLFECFNHVFGYLYKRKSRKAFSL